jgi:Holliday junction resolvase
MTWRPIPKRKNSCRKGVHSKRKGAAGEREWAAFLRDLGLQARRGRQYDGLEGRDVVGGWPGTHCEVKRVEHLSIYPAIQQAERDAKEGEVPCVAHRRNNAKWLVTIRATDVERFARCVLGGAQ